MPIILVRSIIRLYNVETTKKHMGYNEFHSAGFIPRDDKQISLFQKFKNLRTTFGNPPQIAYLRSIARTRPYTRTVYPPGWRYA